MGPIFVGGPGRSGKTLTRWLLSSHPRIVVSRRTEMWPRFYGRFHDLDRPQNLERCLQTMLDRKHIAALGPDAARLRREFRRGEPTYARLFALIHEQYAERCGKARWGDQTGLIERYADELMSAYPGAKVIHMIRDPRDRFEALRHRRRAPGAIGETTATWIFSAELGGRNTRMYPDSYRIVRYEDLVSRPEETMRAVFSFLGEEFFPVILRMEGVPRYQAERASARDGIPISTAYVGRYRRRVDRCDLAFIQTVAASQMRALGYAPDPIRLSPSERVRCATVEWPIGLVRMGSWRAREALHRRPNPVPRPPRTPR